MSCPKTNAGEAVQPMGAKTFHEKIKGKRAFKLVKSDDDKRLVFGWASVAVRVTGEVVEDYQSDVIEIDVLEKAA